MICVCVYIYIYIYIHHRLLDPHHKLPSARAREATHFEASVGPCRGLKPRRMNWEVKSSIFERAKIL